MKKLHLALLWHMHQPYYKDEGVYKMPWVFLHAIKDYYDMPRYCELYGAKATFNLVPSLMVQLEDYADHNVDDELLRAMRKKPEDLALDDIEELVPKLFMAQVEYMIGPYANYRRLYNRYIKNKDPLQFSLQEIRDLCVHYLLTWSGMQTRREIPLVARLLQKGGDFSEVEKQELLDELQDWVGRIIAYYRKLQDDGLIEVAVTPFYHPILPLLIDLESAKEALPEIAMPKIPEAFAGFGRDAEWHVAAAVKYYEDKFGRKPFGMWPAEGSVSTAAFKLMAKYGFSWAASDEDVLGGSLVKDLRAPDNRNLLYRKYFMETPDKEICLCFRDKKLSDLLGFTYANMAAPAAVSDFIAKLRRIYEQADSDVVVPVILDGENAWEYYPDGAFPFFAAFYTELVKQDWLEMRTMREIVQDQALPAGRLNEVRAGSWIYGTFSTWIGHSEKNRGWELLTKTEAETLAVWDKLDTERREALRAAMHVAQGSDWFWWYGDDHFSVQAGEYDSLFRSRLIQAYNIAGLPVPEELYTPVKIGSKAGLLRPSTNFIAPVLDGRITSFFEWMGSGLFDVTFDMGAMHQDDRILKMFYWGFGRDYLYLRLDGAFGNCFGKGYMVEIEIELDRTYQILANLNRPVSLSGDLKYEAVAALDEILEIRIPKKALNLDNFENVRFLFKVMHEGKLVERAPAYNYIEIESDLSATFNWMA